MCEHIYSLQLVVDVIDDLIYVKPQAGYSSRPWRSRGQGTLYARSAITPLLY